MALFGSGTKEGHGDWLAIEEPVPFERHLLLQQQPVGMQYPNHTVYSGIWNNTLFYSASNYTSQLKKVTDQSVANVFSALVVNILVFICLMATYEVLRRYFPLVYMPRKVRKDHHSVFGSHRYHHHHKSAAAEQEPEVVGKIPIAPRTPLGWVGPVFGVSWTTVRQAGGLDAYFFLRYIRMCVRITAVSTFWALLILVPAYATGGNNSVGWYYISMANVPAGDWRGNLSVIFMYLMSLFVFFVMKQEYEHFLQLRMDFLGKEDKSGVVSVNPQHHYSLMVENIPMEMRSDTGLFEYFNRLFPGKVHSAHVILNLPELERLSARRIMINDRLEKAIAECHASGERPSLIVSQTGIDGCCGIDLNAKELCGCIKK